MKETLLATVLATVLASGPIGVEIDRGVSGGLAVGDGARIYYELAIGGGKKRIEVGDGEVVSVRIDAAVVRAAEDAEIRPGYFVEIDVPAERLEAAALMAAVGNAASDAADEEIEALASRLATADERLSAALGRKLQPGTSGAVEASGPELGAEPADWRVREAELEASIERLESQLTEAGQAARTTGETIDRELAAERTERSSLAERLESKIVELAAARRENARLVSALEAARAEPARSAAALPNSEEVDGRLAELESERNRLAAELATTARNRDRLLAELQAQRTYMSSLREAEQENEAVDDRLASALAELEAKRTDTASLLAAREESEAARERLTAALAEKTRLTADLEAANRDLERLRGRETELAALVETGRSQLESVQTNLAARDRELAVARAAGEGTGERVEASRAEVNRLRAELDAARRELESRRGESSAVQTRLDGAVRDLEIARLENERLEEMIAVRAERSASAKRVARLDADGRRAEIEKLRQAAARSEGELRQLLEGGAGTERELRERLEEAETALALERRRAAVAATAAQTATNAQNRLSNELATAEQRLQQEVTARRDLDRRLDRANAEVMRYEGRTRGSEGWLRQQLERAERELEVNRKVIAGFRAAQGGRGLVSQLEQAARLETELRQQIGEIYRAQELLQLERDQAMGTRRSAEAAHESMSRQVGSLDAEVTRLRRELALVRDDLAAERRARATLEEAASETEGRLRAELDGLRAELSSLGLRARGSESRSREEAIALRAELAGAVEEIAVLEAELAAAGGSPANGR